MATQTPLNTFRNNSFELTTSTQIIYSTPVGITTIVLGAMASNFGDTPATIRFTLVKPGGDEFILLKDFEIPPNDAAEVTTSKLVLEEAASIKASAGADNTINLIFSILETSNE
jgi:hypothetical protein